MVERQEVEAVLARTQAVNEAGVIQCKASTLAALCRAWLAAEEAPRGSVVESGWNDEGYHMDGRVYELPTSMIGQRVRIVPVEGDQ